MKKSIGFATVLTVFFLMTGLSFAGGAPFRVLHDQPPYTFTFGNHFDSHQQTKLMPNGELSGFLYVKFVDVAEDGVPIAEHCDDNTPPEDCVAVWTLRGKPGVATAVAHEADDHPIFLAAREDIPQPGSYTHFHWLGTPQTAADLAIGDPYDGYFLELQATAKFWFRFGAFEILVTPGIDTATHTNVVGSFPGY